MKSTHTLIRTICVSALFSYAFPAVPRFEKLTDHCYLFQPASGGTNVGAIVTNGGVLLINPPSQPALSAVLDALRRLTPKPATWVVNTDYQLETAGGSAQLTFQDAILLACKEQQPSGSTLSKVDDKDPPSQRKDDKTPVTSPKTESIPRFYFTRQVHLFPDGLEIRVASVGVKARTPGDVVVFVPAEKTLYTGNLFQPGSYPEINSTDGTGSSLGWIDGMRRVVEMVPLTKSAMPQPKSDPSKPPQEEKSLEERVTVVGGSGGRSNLQELKNLLEAAQKLRNEISKSISSGRTRDNFLSLPAVSQYSGYGNFESFAKQLYDELAAQKAK